MDMKLPQHPFVSFVDDLIDNPLVKSALHHLQTRQGVNTNLILYTIWLGQYQRGRLVKQDHKTLLSTIHAWHERILTPLQRLQRSVSEHARLNHPTMIKAIDAEIDMAEQIERL